MDGKDNKKIAICTWEIRGLTVASMSVCHDNCQIFFRILKEHRALAENHIRDMAGLMYNIERAADGDSWLYIFTKKEDWDNAWPDFQIFVDKYWFSGKVEMIPAS